MSRKIYVLLFILTLTLSPVISAQDMGTADTVRIGTVSGDVYGALSVPVTLYNDYTLITIVIPVAVDGYSGWMRFDSITYTGGRLEDANILPQREYSIVNSDGFSTEILSIGFTVAMGDPLPPGDGIICDLWFTPLFGGAVFLDTMAVSPNGPLMLMDVAMNDYTPEFKAGSAVIACDYLVGDVRTDGGVNVGDIVGFMKQYLTGVETRSPAYYADVNCDRHVDMRDWYILWMKVWAGGTLCECGNYSPAVYNDPGMPDTLRIDDRILFVGIPDSVAVRLIYDEQIRFWSLGLDWDGSGVLDPSGNPGHQDIFNEAIFNGAFPGETVIRWLPFTPESTGTVQMTMGNLQYGLESMVVTSLGEAVIPVVVGGEIRVLPRPCGDANGDGLPNVGDAVYLINYVFKGGPPPEPACFGDANGDGDVNVGDAVYLINFVFKGGPPPLEECCP